MRTWPSHRMLHPPHPAMMPGSGSRCARTATTTPPTWYGTTRQAQLWRRTKQAIERHLGQLGRRRGVTPIRVPYGDGKYRLIDPVRVAHGKAGEYQARGAVDFHALLRLDGYYPAHPEAAAASARRPHHRRPGRRHPGGLPRPSATAVRPIRPGPGAGPSPGAPRSTSASSP